MMNRIFVQRFGRYACSIMLLCSLSSCDLLDDKHSKKGHRSGALTKHYNADDYIKYLALAKIEPENNDANIGVINSYAAEKKKKAERQPILILEYKRKGEGQTQQVAAPISLKNTSQPMLADIFAELPSAQYQLHNLRVATVKITPSKDLKITTDTQGTVDHQERRLINDAASLSPVDTIRAELRLARFFVDNRFRDAAYIAVDNIKHSLAALPHATPDDQQTAKSLSEKLEKVESDMRKVMPFNL